MAGFLRGILNSADEIVRGNTDILAKKYVQNGPKIRSNKAATDTSTLLGRAVNTVKKSKLGNAIIPAPTPWQTEAISDAMRNEIVDMGNVAKQNMLKHADDAEALKNYQGIANRASYFSPNANPQGSFTVEPRLGDKLANYYGDAKYGTTRALATGGLVASAMVGGRFLSGGDLTHNGNGERDIVGIPFV